MNDFKKNKVSNSLNQFIEYLNRKCALYNYLSSHFQSQNLELSTISAFFNVRETSHDFYPCHKNILIITMLQHYVYKILPRARDSGPCRWQNIAASDWPIVEIQASDWLLPQHVRLHQQNKPHNLDNFLSKQGGDIRRELKISMI